MAARSRCGQARIQPVSHFSRAATERATAPIADDVGLVMSELLLGRPNTVPLDAFRLDRTIAASP